MTIGQNNAAPWRENFLADMGKLSMPACVLSTLHTKLPRLSYHPDRERDQQSFRFTPRARTIIFRGMWATLPENDRNPAPRNDPIYESDILAFTTDVRMEKTTEIFVSGGSDIPETSKDLGTGGGGPVEVVFWIPDAMTQWRIRGKAYLIAPDIESDNAKNIRNLLQTRMRATSFQDQVSSQNSWSWSKELTRHFGNLSPGMRGTFRNPPSGMPRSRVPENPNLKLGQEVNELEDPVARRNFRVLAIIPEGVDQVNLKDQTRCIYEYVSSNGNWEMYDVWP